MHHIREHRTSPLVPDAPRSLRAAGVMPNESSDQTLSSSEAVDLGLEWSVNSKLVCWSLPNASMISDIKAAVIFGDW